MKALKKILPLLALLSASQVFAAAAGMPWETPLQTIKDSLSGNTLGVLTIIAIVLAGIGLAFTEGGSGMRKFVYLICGLALASGATTIAASLGFVTAGLAF